MISFLLSKVEDEDLRENIAVGLAGGLTGGLAVGLAWPLWVVFPLVVVVGEILFMGDKLQPQKKQNKFWFTFWHKIEALLESLIIVVNTSNLFKLSREVDVSLLWMQHKQILLWMQHKQMILQYLGYFGIIIIGVSVFTGYIWLNTRRYKTK